MNRTNANKAFRLYVIRQRAAPFY